MTHDSQLTTALVRFQDVGFLHAGRPEVLGRLNLSVGSGEMIAVVGRSGAGKTTLLKLVNRLLLPTSGAVVVEGRDTRDWDGIRLRRRIGYVFQDVGLFPHMTIEENIEVVPRLEQWPPERARARAHQLLDLVGLPPRIYASRRPDELSGGQRQRVGLARALAIDPPILLMDEPFGALDPLTRDALGDDYRALHTKLGLTTVMITHDMTEAILLADRIAVMRGGRLLAQGTAAELSQSDDAYVGELLRTPRRQGERLKMLLPHGSTA
jgi:osmoprotectant transport system ATP-binding protein